VNVLLAIVGLPLVLILPGWSTVAALAPLRRLDWLERLYLVLGASLAIGGWLGVLLAETGGFSLWLLLGLLILYSAVLGWLAWRRGVHPVRWPAAPSLSLRETIPLVVVTVLFAVLAFRPFELILGPKDAAVYPATGVQIARQGGFLIHDPLVAEMAPHVPKYPERLWSQFFPPQHPGRFYYAYARMPGFFIASFERGTVVPQFYPLYPAWLATAFGLVGVKAGLLMTPYLMLLGGVGVFLVARRLFGPWVALAAYLFLSLNTLQVWFARYSVSEGGTQFLLFLAAWGLLRLEEEDDPFWGVLAGVSFGLIGLVRVDFLFTWGLLLPYLAYLFVARRFRRTHRLFLLCLGLLAIHTVVQLLTLTWGYTLSTYYHRLQDWYILSWLVQPFLNPTLREYFHGRTPVMQQPWRLAYELGVPLLLAALLLLLRRAGRLRTWIGERLRRHRRLLLGLAAGLFLLAAAYAYLVRPGILTPQVLLHPLQNRPALEGYVGAPVPEGAAANLVRLGWYLSPLGMVLGVAGVAGLLLREANRRSWFLLLLGLFNLAFFSYELYGVEHHVYIMRRYVPVVIPFLSVGMAYCLVWLAQAKWLRRAGKVAAGLLGVAMVVYLAYTGWPFFRHTEYRGALVQVGKLAERFTAEDIVLLIEDERDAPFAVATPLQYLFDRNALVIRSTPPRAELIEEQIQRWQSLGRRVYLLVGNDGGRLFLPHTRLHWLDRFELAVSEFQQLRTQKPHNSYILRLPFGLYEPQEWRGPGSPLGDLPVELDLGSGGYVYQAGGFHRDERTPDGTTFCWTKGEGVLRLPWPEEGVVTITLRLAGGKRPAALGPAQVALFFGDWQVGAWVLEEGFSTQVLSVRAESVVPGEGRTVLLRLVSPTWRQADYGLGQDLRPLGIQVDWVRVEVGQRPLQVAGYRLQVTGCRLAR